MNIKIYNNNFLKKTKPDEGDQELRVGGWIIVQLRESLNNSIINNFGKGKFVSLNAKLQASSLQWKKKHI